MSLYCIVYDGEDIVLRDGLLEAAAEQRFVQAVCCCGGQRAEIDAAVPICRKRSESDRPPGAVTTSSSGVQMRAASAARTGRRTSRSMPTGPPCTAQHTKFPEWLQLKAGPSGT